jgi:hypothetical protein
LRRASLLLTARICATHGSTYATTRSELRDRNHLRANGTLPVEAVNDDYALVIM